MQEEPTVWRLTGLRDYFAFVHNKMLDHSFAWVLGAGASKSSGIPTGGELVDRWLKALHSRIATDDISFEEWATNSNLEIDGFDLENRSWFYPQVYQRCFRDHPDEGYAFLEDLMAARDPGPGYSILAKILEATRHRVVITTNFDNLVADALSIYTETFPFVCGHESLAGFVRVSMRRPLVCKIHRDLLLGPQNDPRSLKRLHDSWGSILRLLLQSYTPVFIGYGGNDDTLMDLLESLEPDEIKGQLIWCYYEGDGLPKPRIRKLVAQHKGALVAVPDFDLLMVLLGAAVGIEPLDEVIENRAKERASKYRERIIDLDTSDHPEIRHALATTFERGGWKVWARKADEATTVIKALQIYERAAEIFSNNKELLLAFAWFLEYRIGDPLRAEEYYKKARNIDADDPAVAGAFALFLWKEGRYDDAESLFKRAMQSNSTAHLANYANFLARVRNRPKDAERLYRRALRTSKGDPDLTLEFADFLGGLEGKEDEAETYYTTSIRFAPHKSKMHARFGQFLAVRCSRYDDAAKEYEVAIGCDNLDTVLPLELAALRAIQKRYDDALFRLEDLCQRYEHPIEFQFRWTLYAAVINCAAHAAEIPGKSDDDDRRNLELLLRNPFKRQHFDLAVLRLLINMQLPAESQKFYTLCTDALENEESAEKALQCKIKDETKDSRKSTGRKKGKTSGSDENFIKEETEPPAAQRN